MGINVLWRALEGFDMRICLYIRFIHFLHSFFKHAFMASNKSVSKKFKSISSDLHSKSFGVGFLM